MPTLKSLALATALTLPAAAALAGSLGNPIPPHLAFAQGPATAVIVSDQATIYRPEPCTQLELSAGLSGVECGVLDRAELTRLYLELHD